MADAGEILMGGFGRELLGGAQLLFLIFIMGSHILTFTIMMNMLTDHGTCSIVFGIVGLIVSLIGALPRTLKKVSYLAVIGEYCLPSTSLCMDVLLWVTNSFISSLAFISIVASVIITMVSIGVQHPGKRVDITVKTDLFHGFIAVTNIVFAYGKWSFLCSLNNCSSTLVN